jgi:hypothetical protein
MGEGGKGVFFLYSDAMEVKIKKMFAFTYAQGIHAVM